MAGDTQGSDAFEPDPSLPPINDVGKELLERIEQVIDSLKDQPCKCGKPDCDGVTLHRILTAGPAAHRWDSVAAALILTSSIIDSIVDDIYLNMPAESIWGFQQSVNRHCEQYMRMIAVNIEINERRN